MNTPRGEISTIVILTTFAVLAVATLVTTTLNKEVQTTETKAAASACPYDSGVALPLGKTESDANNAENRVPISQNRALYDSLANTSGFAQIADEGVLTLTKTDGGAVDSGAKNMMASMFGYKPKRLAGALDPPDGGTYILEVPTDTSHNEVKMPATGYDIGGGYEAMVVFAAADRVTLHVGRHEYFTGTKTCANGKTCSGGYYIYVKGLCVDQQIVNAYNTTKGAQESAGADLNPIDLPMVRAGHVLGKATGNSVLVGVRDNGPFISLYKPDYWGGVSEVDTGSGGEAGPTNSYQDTDLNSFINAKCKVRALEIDLDSNNKITLFDVTTPPTSECSPKVSYADEFGKKKEHIAGPVVNSTYWGRDGAEIEKFHSIQFVSGVSQYFYIEMVKTNGEVTDAKPFECGFSGRGGASCNSMRPGDIVTTTPRPTTAPAAGTPTSTPTTDPAATPTPTLTGLRTTSAQTGTVAVSSSVYLPACDGSTLASAAQGIGTDENQECIMISTARPL